MIGCYALKVPGGGSNYYARTRAGLNDPAPRTHTHNKVPNGTRVMHTYLLGMDTFYLLTVSTVLLTKYCSQVSLLYVLRSI